MALALLPAALVAAACESQPDSTQARIDNPARGNSVNAQVGDIRLLATRIDAPEERKVLAATSTGLFTTLANDGSQADTLVAVSTSYATRTILRDGADGAERPVNVPVPAHGVVSMQYPGQTHLELVDLKVDVRAGRLLPVQFRFARAGTATVNVFVDGFGLPTVSPVTPTGS
ncbi:copper chaperone PCu(A)C [Intrasporangium sp. YIM S08009]|uniref:copper chaperone PCu(A)C n=1 Tax=Intrasporangium zincisolvens TaxID=3080018 RepID=UPI002B05FF6B|nr:copper chaperone PCu(A)C [Intrasporangium sp. YIM S08009]